jgi:hypothetical protein
MGTTNITKIRYVLGISVRPIEDGLVPLNDRVVINASALHTRGYLDVIAPAFQAFSLREKSVLGLHSVCQIEGVGILRALAVCAEIRNSLAAMPRTWRPHIGTIKKPCESQQALAPLVVRRRAIAFIDHVEHLLQIAESTGGAVVFASGAFFRPLCGIKAEPGSQYYS